MWRDDDGACGYGGRVRYVSAVLEWYVLNVSWRRTRYRWQITSSLRTLRNIGRMPPLLPRHRTVAHSAPRLFHHHAACCCARFAARAFICARCRGMGARRAYRRATLLSQHRREHINVPNGARQPFLARGRHLRLRPRPIISVMLRFCARFNAAAASTRRGCASRSCRRHQRLTLRVCCQRAPVACAFISI